MATENNSAARFTRTYNQAQKQALLKAVLIDGHTVADARRMAQTGQLGVPAFNLSTAAYSMVRDGREAFETTNETALARAIEREMHGAELDALAHIRATRQAFNRDALANPEPLRRATLALAAIKKARRDTATRVKPQPNTANTATETPITPYTPSVVTDLLRHAPQTSGQSARTGSLTDARIAPDPPRTA